MQRSKHRSRDADPLETSLGLDILEQITRPNERTVDSSHDLIDNLDEGIEEVSGRHPDRPEGPPPQAARSFDKAKSVAGLTDPVTGLANLPLLLDRLDKALTRRRGADGEVLAIHIELNNFSYVQDQLGEAAANAILKQISRRLLSHLRHEDTVARVGLSELIIGVSLRDEDAIAHLTDRLRASFQIPIDLPDREVIMWASFSSVEAEQTESAADVLARLVESIRLQSPGTSSAWSPSLEKR
jgi:diguanylate cyclase (GGDEF)-like protein